MAYYTLCTKNNGKWFPQFGDYDRDVVKQEIEDSYAGEKCRIVKSKTARKRDVETTIELLNVAETAH